MKKILTLLLSLTLVFAALSGMRPSMTKFPQEKITVG